MIELTILNYLTTELAPTPVMMEIPRDPPAEFVVVEKTGSGENNKLFSAIFAIQSYSDTLYNAAYLNDAVKQAMAEFADESNEISACFLNSDYNFTDPESKRYRYQAVYEIYHY